MNGILGQQVPERTSLFRPGRPAQGKQTQQQYTQSTPAAVHRVHSVPTKNPEPVCILGCCGIGKISILWTVSTSTTTTRTTRPIIIIVISIASNNILRLSTLLEEKMINFFECARVKVRIRLVDCHLLVTSLLL